MRATVELARMAGRAEVRKAEEGMAVEMELGKVGTELAAGWLAVGTVGEQQAASSIIFLIIVMIIFL